MDRVNRINIKAKTCEGRTYKEAFGSSGYVKDDDTSMGFLTVSANASGKICKADKTESYLVENVKDAWVLYENKKEVLEKGDVLVMGSGDYYSYEFDSDDGYIDFVYFIPNFDK